MLAAGAGSNGDEAARGLDLDAAAPVAAVLLPGLAVAGVGVGPALLVGFHELIVVGLVERDLGVEDALEAVQLALFEHDSEAK